MRCKIFEMAGCYHPLVQYKDRLFEHSEMDVKQIIAQKLGRPHWSEIEVEMFADVFEFNRLKSFHGYDTSGALLSRYNVAQVQASLFNAKQLVSVGAVRLPGGVSMRSWLTCFTQITPPPEQ